MYNRAKLTNFWIYLHPIRDRMQSWVCQECKIKKMNIKNKKNLPDFALSENGIV